jgi:hypothetical protein
VDLVGADGENQSYFVATGGPGIRPTKVSLGESLNVLCRTLCADVHDPPSDGEVTRRIDRIGHAKGHARISLNVPDFLEALNSIDEDVFTVGVTPCLGELRRSVRHRRGDVTDAGPPQQGSQFFG